MSVPILELEKELELLDPEDAIHIRRAVHEMLQVARRKQLGKPNKELSHGRQNQPYQTDPQPLGLRPGLSYENWTDLLDEIERPG